MCGLGVECEAPGFGVLPTDVGGVIEVHEETFRGRRGNLSGRDSS